MKFLKNIAYGVTGLYLALILMLLGLVLVTKIMFVVV